MSLFLPRDPFARLDAECDQRIGDAVGLDVEFGERRLTALEFERRRIAAVLCLRADHVGKVRRCCRSGHVSPVGFVFVVVILASASAKDNTGQRCGYFNTRRPGQAKRERADPYAAAHH